jgi:hypothetical protein
MTDTRILEAARALIASGEVGPKSKPMMIRLCDALEHQIKHPKVISPDGRSVYSKDDYDLCDKENENLRRHLAWAGALLTPDQRRDLAKRIDKPIDDGGVTEDSVEEDREEILRALLTLKRAADHLEKGAHGVTSGLWPAQASSLVNQARAYEPILDATLAEVRKTVRT